MRLVDKFERTIAAGFDVVAAISCFFLASSTVAIWQVKILICRGNG